MADLRISELLPGVGVVGDEFVVARGGLNFKIPQESLNISELLSGTRVNRGASGATPHAAADDFAVEGTGAGGMSVLVDDATGVATYAFGTDVDNFSAAFTYTVSTNILTMGTNRAGGAVNIASADGTVGINIDESQNVTIKPGVSGATPEAAANTFVIEDVSAGMSLLSQAGNLASFYLGDATIARRADISFNVGANVITLQTRIAGGLVQLKSGAGVEGLRIDGDQNVGTRFGASGATVDVNAKDFVVEGVVNAGFSILTQANGITRHYMGTAAKPFGAGTTWHPGSGGDILRIGTNIAGGIVDIRSGVITTGIRIDASQDILMGVTAKQLAGAILQIGKNAVGDHGQIFTGNANGTGYIFGRDNTGTGNFVFGEVANAAATSPVNLLTIVTGAPTGGVLYIKKGASGTSPNATGDDLVVEFAASGGISLLGGTTDNLNIFFGSTLGVTAGQFLYNPTSEVFTWATTGTAGALNMRSGANVLAATIDATQHFTIKPGQSAAGTASPLADDLIIENNTHSGMTIKGTAGAVMSINMMSVGSTDDFGHININSGTAEMIIGTNNAAGTITMQVGLGVSKWVFGVAGGIHSVGLTVAPAAKINSGGYLTNNLTGVDFTGATPANLTISGGIITSFS